MGWRVRVRVGCACWMSTWRGSERNASSCLLSSSPAATRVRWRSEDHTGCALSLRRNSVGEAPGVAAGRVNLPRRSRPIPSASASRPKSCSSGVSGSRLRSSTSTQQEEAEAEAEEEAAAAAEKAEEAAVPEEAAEAAAEEAAAEAEAVGGSRQEGATADVELGQLLSDRFRQLSFRLSSSLGMEPEGRRAHESIAEEGPATDDQDEQLHSSRAVAQQAQLLAEAASVAVNRKDPTEGVASAVLDA